MGLQVAIASSATEAELEMLLKISQIEGLIREATTSSDAEASKPAPDIVSVALQDLRSQRTRRRQTTHTCRAPIQRSTRK